MKCKICGYRARTIAGLGAHYRKKHLQRLKRGPAGVQPAGDLEGVHFCPYCGRRINWGPWCDRSR